MTDDMRTERSGAKNLSKEEKVYANILYRSSRIGLIFLVFAAIVYFAGILPQETALDSMHEYWHLSLRSYRAAVQKQETPRSSWHWIGRINRGEYFAYLPVAFLGLITVACFIRLVPIFLRKRDYTYLVIVCVEVLVLVLAISGILNSGN